MAKWVGSRCDVFLMKREQNANEAKGVKKKKRANADL